MKLKSILGSLLAVLLAQSSLAAPDALDAEGYPIFYIAGAQTGWNRTASHQMSRQGNCYSITLPELNGEFKITGSEWQYNLGAESSGVSPESGRTITGVQNGQNFIANNLSNITISFNFNENDKGSGSMSPTPILFGAQGKMPQPQGMSGTLPILYINVYFPDTNVLNNEIIDKDLDHKDYFTGEYYLDMNGCQWLIDLGVKDLGSAEEPLPLEIKARGNWTRKGFAKKPYKLKLGSKQAMLGLSKSKHFALLAHADDNMGYLRNFTGFNLGRRIGLPWTPAQQPVEVVINGNYRGLYFLTESIRIENGRVNIASLNDLESEPALISGGYLVELDNYDETNQIQLPEQTCVPGHIMDVLRITWDTPEEYSDIQKRFITDQFSVMNNLVGQCNNDLWQYLDLDDAARYYLVEEIISHTESYHGSTYLFRDRGEGEKWHFSPLWDCGNAFNGPSDQFFYNCDPFGNTWIPSIRTNAMFNKKVNDTWMWFMNNGYNGLIDDIKEYAQHIAAAAVADSKRWGNAPLPSYPGAQQVADNSDMNAKSDGVINKLNAKIDWLKQHFGNFTENVQAAEPARDTTPAAPLPSYAIDPTYGVELTPADNNPDNTVPTTSTTQFYNIQGQKIKAPAKGQIYIKVTTTDTTKAIN